MFGLTFEKLFLVTLVAGVVLGPQRLPVYAHQLAQALRALRDVVETTRSRAEREMGVSLERTTWESVDLRQYDPRRIVQDALREPPSPPPDAAAPDPGTVVTPEILAEAERVRPGQRYLVTGSAAHPRRVAIDSLAADDPRRVAACPPALAEDEREPSLAVD